MPTPATPVMTNGPLWPPYFPLRATCWPRMSPLQTKKDRAQVAQLAEQEQDVTDALVEIASVDQGATGDRTELGRCRPWDGARSGQTAASEEWLRAAATAWVVERSFGWASRFRRLARGYERLPGTLAGWHVVAIAILMLACFVALMVARCLTRF